MAATGEPYSVAARALDAAEAAAEPMAAAGGTAEPGSAEAAAAAEPISAESAAAEPIAAEPPAAPAAQTEALAEVIACAGRTLAAPSARIQIRDDTDPGRDPVPALRRPLRSRPGLLGQLTRRAAKAALGRVAPGTGPAGLGDHFLHQFGAGFIDLAGGRYLVDFGGHAQALVDGRRFGGLSGEPLGPRYELRPHKFRRDDPLDALRKLQRATAARWAGTEQVRWTTCRVITATVGADEFTVWIDGKHVRRFQTVERGSGRYARATKTETVELWDFGVPVDELDWSRLPTFRTPG
jgi:hypothetical protein